MSVINIEGLTKNYGMNHGVFDINLQIEEGEVYGYLGPNGAGKSTTMWHLMGFIKPDSGKTEIFGLNTWRNRKQLQNSIGYLPGEIALPEDMGGIEYLKLIAKMRGMKSFDRAEELLGYFELNPKMSIKRMSKGMKQKIGIVAAFMHEPKLYLLDEPTSGLDPLMQNKFIELVREEKDKGKTVLLSSHIFEEVEKVCDHIGMIKAGRLIQDISIEELSKNRNNTFVFSLSKEDDMLAFEKKFSEAVYDSRQNSITISVSRQNLNSFLKGIAKYQVVRFEEEKHSLEEYFMKYYGGEGNE